MKIAMITDLHYGTRGGSMYFQDAMDKFIINIVIPTLKKNNISHLFMLGDFTDSRKSTNYRIIKEVRKNFFDVLLKHEISTVFICGNHDIFYKEKNDITSFDVLFGHYENVMPVMSPIDFSKTDAMKADILVLPWINKNNYSDVMTAIESTNAKYCMGHFEIAGAKMYKHSRAEHGLNANLLSKFDVVFSGHYHHRSQYGNIQYIGAAGYYTWQDYDDFRGMTIFDTETGQQETIENPYCLFNRIVYDDSEDLNYKTVDLSDYKGKYIEIYVVNKSDPVQYKDFVKRVYGIDTLGVKVEDRTLVTKSSKSIEIDNCKSRPVIELIYDYTEKNSYRPDEIKKIIKEIHKEAEDIQ